MTQRIFDVENKKDMADLWDILPDMVKRIEKEETNELNPYHRYMADDFCLGGCCYINIDFHDKTEITRPIQEATEQDVGKLCYFWDYDEEQENGTGSFGKLCIIDEHKVEGTKYQGQNIGWFPHCRRLTKQEIEELI